MGEIADMVVNGEMCELCGVCFEEAHGYPVVCESCWDDLDIKEKKLRQKAHEKEL